MDLFSRRHAPPQYRARAQKCAIIARVYNLVMTVKYICHVKFPADVANLWEGWVNFHKAGAPLAAGVIRREIFHGLMDRQGFVFIEAESYAAVAQDLGGFVLGGLDFDLIPVFDNQEATDAILGLMPQLNKS